MALDFTNLFANGIGSILDSSKGIIETFVESPEQKIEAQKVLLNSELEAKKLELQAIEQARQFAIKYEGSAEQIPYPILLLRSLIRPIISYTTLLSFLFFMASDIFTRTSENPTNWLQTLPPQYWSIVQIVFAFWFGSKMVERAIEKVQSNKVAG